MMVGQIKRLFGLGEHAVRTERRQSPRRRTSLTVEIRPVTDYAEFLVETVSRSGFIGRSESPVRPGQQILFGVSTPSYHVGTVRWVKGSRFGVLCAGALEIFGYEPGKTRTQRYRVNLQGKIAIAPVSFRAKLRDVSQLGLRLDSDILLAPGQQLLVQIHEGRFVPASVEWAADSKVGLKIADRIAILRLVYSYD